LNVEVEVDLGQKVGQLRATPVQLGEDANKAFLAVYCADFDVDDPYHGMFLFPTDTLKLAKRDLGRSIVPVVLSRIRV
jgi:hypothetical protein